MVVVHVVAGAGGRMARAGILHPQTGRWLSRDPVEERGGMNLYNYTENASARFTDKLGLFKWDSSCTDTEKKQ